MQSFIFFASNFIYICSNYVNWSGLKILSIILIIYVLILTLSPCVDSHASSCLILKEIAQKDNHSNSSEINLCSPFCTCNCCQVISLITLVSLIKTVDTSPTSFKTAYNHSILKDISFSIWQPPKL
jgi:hypothetical protein